MPISKFNIMPPRGLKQWTNIYELEKGDTTCL